MTLKAETDIFDDLEDDDNNIFSIKRKLLQFLDEFEKKFDSKFTEKFFVLINKIRSTITFWIDTIRKNRTAPENTKVPFPLYNNNYLKKKETYEPLTYSKIKYDKVIDDTNQDMYN